MLQPTIYIPSRLTKLLANESAVVALAEAAAFWRTATACPCAG